MKNLFYLVFISFLTPLALAFPKVGDVATFNGLFEGGGGGSLEFLQTLSIKSEDLSGPVPLYTMVTQMVVEGRTQTQEQVLNLDDLLNLETVNQILNECASHGGTLETVTVEAGAFNSCAVDTTRGGKIWIANAPFGIIKNIIIDDEENRITLELKKYKFGQ